MPSAIVVPDDSYQRHVDASFDRNRHYVGVHFDHGAQALAVRYIVDEDNLASERFLGRLGLHFYTAEQVLLRSVVFTHEAQQWRRCKGMGFPKEDPVCRYAVVRGMWPRQPVPASLGPQAIDVFCTPRVRPEFHTRHDEPVLRAQAILIRGRAMQATGVEVGRP